MRAKTLKVKIVSIWWWDAEMWSDGWQPVTDIKRWAEKTIRTSFTWGRLLASTKDFYVVEQTLGGDHSAHHIKIPKRWIRKFRVIGYDRIPLEKDIEG